MIEAHGLSMHYGSVHALRDATFRAEPGEVVGLLGPNGAGKTTTMRILTTYQQPTGGTARVAGFDVVEDPLEVRRRMGYLPEALPLYLSMEVRDCLRFVGRARGLSGSLLTERIRWVVAKCGLERMFHTPCLHLSKGYRQRTALAQALLHDPEVIVMDEPTTGLDPHQILEIRALVRELAETKTVILSTHIMQEAEALSDRLLVMRNGRIVGAGTSDELRRIAGVVPLVRVRLRGDSLDRRPLMTTFEELLESFGGNESELTATFRDPAGDVARRVGELAHAQGWTVTELSRDPGSLEQMFLALTADDAPDRVPAAPPPDDHPPRDGRGSGSASGEVAA